MELEKEIKLVDLKLLGALEAAKGKKLQTLCLNDIDLAILALWNHSCPKSPQVSACYDLDEMSCPFRLLEGS